MITSPSCCLRCICPGSVRRGLCAYRSVWCLTEPPFLNQASVLGYQLSFTLSLTKDS